MLPTLEITPVDRWKKARKKFEKTKLPALATNAWRQKLLNNVNKNGANENAGEKRPLLLPPLKIHEENVSGSKQNVEEAHVSNKETSYRDNSLLITDDYKKMNFAALSVEKIIRDQIEQVKENIALKQRNVNAVGDLMRKYNSDDADSSFEQLIEEYAKSCMELSSINCSLSLLRQDNTTNIAEVDVYKNEMDEILNEIELEKCHIDQLDRLLKLYDEKQT